MGITNWLKERLPVDGDELRELSNEPVPNHMKRWWFALGGTPAYLFVVQIITGIMLAFYYKAAPDAAWESVAYISDEAAFGWFIRSLHKWAATLMIAAVVLHQMRVYFTGAYRKPREINWMVGMMLLICVLMTGFTGYSLVYEQLSFWGATVGANITDNVPFIGGFMKNMLLGGDAYNANTLSRFFVLHGAVLPAAILGLVFLHITIIRLQGVSELSFEDEPEDKPKHFNFFPDHFFTELILGLSLMILLCTLAIVFPAEMGPKANPLVTPEVIKPEWWFYVAFRWLKMFPETTAIISTGFILFVMIFWPFIDAKVRKTRPASEFSVWVGIFGVLAIIGMTVWEAVVAH
ncbi:MAG: cytochrome bc complex cytochrome b subunit [Planctomycetota bacterium]|jgi:quinol-cytochrome oxidoreductase complex cytochrome b subunit|nr:cytochrome bc complex cytochrome b subunit [Planctomycetota bacterium]MDP6941273.1 cytochrome bc complex cytochrome b subunit [Planctomycetota bacterium]